MLSAGRLHIGLVAGEASGDRLGAALIKAVRARVPDAHFSGMVGPLMLAAGCEQHAHIDELSVMGLVEVLKSYPRLRRLRNRLAERFEQERPDVVVGIDVPDFNLRLEQRLKQAGLSTVHYVCPQAWAWRPGRARSIARACDKLLALLPFEPEFFKRYGVDASFVGHPLADTLPLKPDRLAARRALGLVTGQPVLALMPGSRGQEIDRLWAPFAAAAQLLLEHQADLQVIVCVAAERDRQRLAVMPGALPCEVFVARSHEVLSSADVAIVASGTVTLEAFLCATPTVVGYRLAPLSYHIIKCMMTIGHIALPNILTGSELVPELVQDNMTPAALAAAARRWLDDPAARDHYVQISRQWHQQMRRDAAGRAAEIVLSLCPGQQ